jgi:signal transduction histidine kinase
VDQSAAGAPRVPGPAARLPRPVRPAALLRPGVTGRDVLLLAFLAGVWALELDILRHRPVEMTAGLVLVVASVLLRRSRPTLSLVAAIAPSLSYLAHPAGRFAVWPVVLMIVMSYLAGRGNAQPRPVVLGFAAVAAVALPFTLVTTGLAAWANTVLTMLFAAMLPWGAGRYRRQYAELVRAGWERAGQLEREQRMVAEQARLRERARIAQDMHDSLGHELSLIALRAGAIEVAADLDERHRTAARDLRASATAATERLGQIIGVLRDESEPAPTEPASQTIADLVDRARASGVVVELDRAAASADLPPMVDRAVYRVVQEALTNATKHAPGAAVTVRLADADGETVLTVTSGPPPDGPLRGRTQGRLGLIGLRERVRLVGGTLDATARDGGFEVVARLPHAGTALPQAEDRPAGAIEALEHERRRARRGLLTMIALPAALGGFILVALLGAFLYTRLNSALWPADFDRLQVGQTRAAIEPVLPPIRISEAPPVVREPPVPPGARCEYYRTNRNPFDLSNDMFRLCFAGDRLVTKDALPD